MRGAEGGRVAWRWLKERNAAVEEEGTEAEEEGEKKKVRDKEILRRARREREKEQTRPWDAKGVRRCMKGWKCR